MCVPKAAWSPSPFRTHIHKNKYTALYKAGAAALLVAVVENATQDFNFIEMFGYLQSCCRSFCCCFFVISGGEPQGILPIYLFYPENFKHTVQSFVQFRLSYTQRMLPNVWMQVFVFESTIICKMFWTQDLTHWTTYIDWACTPNICCSAHKMYYDHCCHLQFDVLFLSIIMMHDQSAYRYLSIDAT